MRTRLTLMLLAAAAPAHALTELVGDVRTGSIGSSPQSLTVVSGPSGDELYWLANGDDGVKGIWTLDALGVPLLVTDLADPGPFSGGNRMVHYDDDFYFRGTGGSPATGFEVYRYDTSADELQLVWDLFEGSASSNPQYFTEYDGKLFFVANTNGPGIELRSTDGSFHQTYDIWPGTTSSSPGPMVVFDGSLWFTAQSQATADFHPCRFTAGAPIFYFDVEDTGELFVYNGELYTVGKDDPSEFQELLRFTGTTFESVADVDPDDLFFGNPIKFPAVLSDGIYFAGNDGVHGYELWRWDGTLAMLDDAVSGADGIYPFDIAETTGGVVYTSFAAPDEELYVFDGTSTEMLADINETGSSEPENGSWNEPAAVISGVYYFSADDGVNGRELWRTDGMSDATPVGDDHGADGAVLSGPMALTAPRPNPTDGVTAFTFRVDAPGEVRVSAFDVAGRKVAELFGGRVAAGTAVPITWDVSSTAPGVYFVRLDPAMGPAVTRRVVRMP